MVPVYCHMLLLLLLFMPLVMTTDGTLGNEAKKDSCNLG